MVLTKKTQGKILIREFSSLSLDIKRAFSMHATLNSAQEFVKSVIK